MGIEVSLDYPNDLRVTVYDPLGGVPVAELEVIKGKVTPRVNTIANYLRGASSTSRTPERLNFNPSLGV